ncbi:MAG: tRNA (adenosine(37)-N6)-threonylcarbamoyltransferase complex dimerization subunit type 1 TsaB [Bacteroidetes bacterium]|nr:tRNA (adenosine(37)-N6)-threonylcarbamoyltransferase complex dimerization subunit type 1 TsaB [Bacteroidota bacterium]
MSYILNIDTSEQTASICLSSGEAVSPVLINETRNDHAAWLHPAIEHLLRENNIRIDQLSAVAVSAGPGSYTGLRVSMSAAKGLCYALKLPLITVSTLEMAAKAVQEDAEEWICPMIDARRMEVFTGVFDTHLHVIKEPHALILDEYSVSSLINDKKVLFCGSGSTKLLSLFSDTALTVSEKRANAFHLALIAMKKFQDENFADAVYTEPFYVKEFYSADQKK